jgi:hypothetical protein
MSSTTTLTHLIPLYIVPVKLEGARFFAHVQTGPGAHTASCTTGTGPFPGVKQSGHGADHPPPSSANITNEYSYISTPPLGLWGLLQGKLYFI